ncbi:hypothetical protein AB0G05_33855 [Nonomuraea wenchangensis]
MVKVNLIAAGGVLAAAVAIIGVAGPANAVVRCDLGSTDKTHSFGIDAEAERIWFTSQESKSCQYHDGRHHDGWDRSDDSDDDSDDRSGRASDRRSDDGFDGGFDRGFDRGFKGGSDEDPDDYAFDRDSDGDFDGGFDKHGRDRGRGWGWVEPDDHGRTWGANGYRYEAAKHGRH